jgi:hypothetical protein
MIETESKSYSYEDLRAVARDLITRRSHESDPNEIEAEIDEVAKFMDENFSAYPHSYNDFRRAFGSYRFTNHNARNIVGNFFSCILELAGYDDNKPVEFQQIIDHMDQVDEIPSIADKFIGDHPDETTPETIETDKAELIRFLQVFKSQCPVSYEEARLFFSDGKFNFQNRNARSMAGNITTIIHVLADGDPEKLVTFDQIVKYIKDNE